MILFDGYAHAQLKESALQKAVVALADQKFALKIGAILYSEDVGSALYTNLKRDAASRVGIEYETHVFSFRDKIDDVLAAIRQLNEDPTVTGIIIQKPTRARWAEGLWVGGDAKDIKKTYDLWWQLQTSTLSPSKDVDGLHPETMMAIQNGTWRESGKVLPATVKAVLYILNQAGVTNHHKVAILNKSDILGLPLMYELHNQGYSVGTIGSKDLDRRKEEGIALKDVDVVISGTGHADLITGDVIKEGAVVIDVGEPKGDVETKSVKQKASFLTPVPGGVGPLTVVSLLENAVELIRV